MASCFTEEAASTAPRGADTAGGPLDNPDLKASEGRLLILERTFPGGFSIAYVPYGPELPEGLSPEAASLFLSSLAVAAQPHLKPCCFLLRFDLTGGTRGPVSAAANIPHPRPLPPPLKSAPYRVRPPDTVILNLAPDEETLLAGMHKKTRYNIRLAAKKGVEVTRLNGEQALAAIPAWYQLYEETGKRDGIALHPESYYRRLFSGEAAGSAVKPLAGEKGILSNEPKSAVCSAPHQEPSFSLYLAEHEGQALAGIIVGRIGRRSTYMYGASGGRKRELMPNYLLQWRAISDARAEGAEEYDFFGIPPSDDPSHPMHGLWRMKTGFGGEIRHYWGAWDYPLRPVIYRFYAFAEKLRGMWAALKKRGR